MHTFYTHIGYTAEVVKNYFKEGDQEREVAWLDQICHPVRTSEVLIWKCGCGHNKAAQSNCVWERGLKKCHSGSSTADFLSPFSFSVHLSSRLEISYADCLGKSRFLKKNSNYSLFTKHAKGALWVGVPAELWEGNIADWSDWPFFLQIWVLFLHLPGGNTFSGHGLENGIQRKDRNKEVCKFFIFPAVETIVLRAEVTSSGETRASY